MGFRRPTSPRPCARQTARKLGEVNREHDSESSRRADGEDERSGHGRRDPPVAPAQTLFTLRRRPGLAGRRPGRSGPVRAGLFRQNCQVTLDDLSRARPVSGGTLRAGRARRPTPSRPAGSRHAFHLRAPSFTSGRQAAAYSRMGRILFARSVRLRMEQKVVRARKNAAEWPVGRRKPAQLCLDTRAEDGPDGNPERLGVVSELGRGSVRQSR